MSKFINMNQIRRIIKMHFIVSGIAMFFGIIFPVFIINGINRIASGVFTLVYMLVLYSTSADIAAHDKKQYTETKAYPWKGIVLPVGIFVVWGFLFLLYHVSWKYHIVNPEFLSGFINNFLFVMWNYIYMGFMQIVDGSFNVWAASLVFIVPMVACFAGYFAGYKGFDVSEKVVKIVYDKKEDEITAGEDGE